MSKKSKGSHGRKQVKLSVSNNRPELRMSSTAGALSPFGGLPLLAKIEKLLGLIACAAAKIQDTSHSAFICMLMAQL